ncbi:hypothetical protein [Derxia gummosa]|uniref:Transporter n=1 Tax=Derxia gummosa DSM 723 TaxID=1121388 RepID=A0A8B6X566_9BURK|nr:hypothetical protein [Derxia gummosa]
MRTAQLPTVRQRASATTHAAVASAPRHLRRALAPLLLATGLAAAPAAQASCGSAFCLVNTDFAVQGAWLDHGWRADLRYELVQQNRLQRGSRTIAPADLDDPSEVEQRTRTQRVIASLDYGFNANWGLSLQLPFLDRVHEHLADGEPVDWHFRQMGDARVTGRWQSDLLGDTAGAGSVGLVAGFKLPTGRTDVRNADQTPAERALQPGTGTTDLVLGGYWRGLLPASDLSWFAQVQTESALAAHDGFRPGNKLGLDLGLRFEGATVAPMLQLNWQLRARDSGAEAEPDNSGGRTLALSPGLSAPVAAGTQVYAFAQIPVHSRVNGVQLSPRWALSTGISQRF